MGLFEREEIVGALEAAGLEPSYNAVERGFSNPR